jgi:hypothetical protein
LWRSLPIQFWLSIRFSTAVWVAAATIRQSGNDHSYGGTSRVKTYLPYFELLFVPICFIIYVTC